MSTFDEEKLQRALCGAADGFLISEGAIDRILDEARELPSTARQPRVRAFIQRTGPVRSSLMAVAACVVLLVVAVPLFNAESPAPSTNALKDVHGAAVPKNQKSLTPGAPGLVTGTGSTQDVSGEFSVVGSTVTLTDAAAKLLPKGASTTSSLRVEEVGTIRLSVGDKKFQATLTQLTDFATTDGGFVVSTQSHMGSKSSHSYSTGSIVLSVPEHKFTMLVDQVRHAGVATSVVTSANDVTGQYVDLQARIQALRVSRAQYLKIMTRTNSIGGILAVQDQLNSIQSQIEQLQAQLGLLNSETTYATLTVSVTEAGHGVAATKHPATGLDKAWHESLHGFAAGVEWLVRIAGPLLFALLVLAALLLLGRWTWRATERRRNRMT